MAYTTINKPNSYFDTQTWVGTNASGRTFTGLNFQPDYIWVKCYNSSNYYQMMVDRVRGGNYFLATAITAAEDNKSHGEITSWNSGGTTWIDGTNASYPRLYYNDGVGSSAGGSEYVAWQFKAGNSAGSSNTSGSITSTVSASTTSGFSIVSYTGTGSAGTVGHGLGVAPRFIIVKNRNSATNWSVYSKALVDKTGNSASDLILNGSNADLTDASYFNSTAPTSTVFSIGSNSGVTGSGNSIIAYCFADVKGYSKFGSYTGNGADNGTFIYTGFKPAFLMIKRTDSADGWLMFDNKRNTFNPENRFLQANLANSEGTFSYCDFTSNGFKARTSAASFNASGGTYIYMCFAENPFVSSTSIPTTAR
jgi:hypothetical protein